jgi:hypothetical protein
VWKVFSIRRPLRDSLQIFTVRHCIQRYFSALD